MCGRFGLVDVPDRLAEAFDLQPPPIPPRSNVCPGQPITVLLRESGRSRAVFQDVLWGYLPFWAKEAKQPFINARADTAFAKPSFKASMRHHRCLIPASWFYEWKRDGTTRTPYRIGYRTGEHLMLGGIWSDWDDGTTHLRTVAVLTTEPNAVMVPIHHRMPVIIPRTAWHDWLDPTNQRPDQVLPWTCPAPDDCLAAVPIAMPA